MFDSGSLPVGKHIDSGETGALEIDLNNALKGLPNQGWGSTISLGQVMYRYEIIIYWSDPDDAFIADVPELPGCMAHGETTEEALAQAKEAMTVWLDTAREFGDPIPEPRGRRLMYA